MTKVEHLLMVKMVHILLIKKITWVTPNMSKLTCPRWLSGLFDTCSNWVFFWLILQVKKTKFSSSECCDINNFKNGNITTFIIRIVEARFYLHRHPFNKPFWTRSSFAHVDLSCNLIIYHNQTQTMRFNAPIA